MPYSTVHMRCSDKLYAVSVRCHGATDVLGTLCLVCACHEALKGLQDATFISINLDVVITAYP